MEQTARISITVETTVPVSPELAWEYWTKPAHITQWNQASDDWHTPRAESDLRAGGKFSPRSSAAARWMASTGRTYPVQRHITLFMAAGTGLSAVSFVP